MYSVPCVTKLPDTDPATSIQYVVPVCIAYLLSFHVIAPFVSYAHLSSPLDWFATNRVPPPSALLPVANNEYARPPGSNFALYTACVIGFAAKPDKSKE